MAFTFIKAQGGSVGKSLVEHDKLDLALELLEKAKKSNNGWKTRPISLNEFSRGR